MHRELALKKKFKKFSAFVLDVDGVATDGKIYCTKAGKLFKVFGPDDSDALKIIQKHLPIHFVSADKRGFDISRRRITLDMGFPLHYVPSETRLDWIAKRWDLSRVIYMGDSFLDAHILKEVGFGIAPQNAFHTTKRVADMVTKHNGGDRAIAEATIAMLAFAP